MASFPPPEPKRTFLSTGSLTVKSQESPDDPRARGSRLEELALSHPFTRQLDVVFPADSPSAARLEADLKQFTATYRRVKLGLAEFIAHAAVHVQKHALESDLIAVARSSNNSLIDSDAVWCLDTRGILTIAVDKTAYQCLGLVGQPLPWRVQEDIYIVQISLRVSAGSQQIHVLAFDPRVKKAIEAWDVRRGAGSWDITYYCVSEGDDLAGKAEAHTVEPVIRTFDQLRVPDIALRESPRDEDEKGEWDEEAASLLEWAGMACLGSQRLQANDNPDPYIAVYSPPSPSRTADVKHVRWTGLLPASLVHSVVDSCRTVQFASITANIVLQSPVTYLSPSSPEKTYLRAPRETSEDVWTLLLGAGGERWILAESVGRWDTRWG